mmetsp:Transcript_13690/g.41356  ORF Transcript_13690/g.41356 Transcript_13690/m.41356 type:complete len:690 (-) Transcript_13690:776-2845(-)|eukprot:CAMPEP_0206142854 /NCGR_PEP_ID=MMETSP1473-20131121/18431_1 /ASSEMBLY_ACC=CAM_ASM_001109 /TAXON_ID=1461547 /ORGANISM="Stichococcus sp, Strain RCC1054" /LENGTH=689 /DNA_ID=CAMNT_0053538005 /DNA_START=262 /DNA_END=2331 /DNA_ORIENTATION=+
MCGIFGIYKYKVPSSRKKTLGVVLGGLRQLEYRGYDSAGVCLDGLEQKLVIIKETGKVDRLEELANGTVDAEDSAAPGEEVLQSQAAIGHTRWATHGKPAAINSHPHTSGDANEFVVVHNGIITNHQALKDFLIKQGESFQTQTDTEVIPKLCKVVYERAKVVDSRVSFFEVVSEVVSQLEGAFALLIKSTHFPTELIAAKKGSPLLLGLVEKHGVSRRSRPELLEEVTDTPFRKSPSSRPFEAFFSSDASALVKHTRRVVTLEDHDMVHIHNGRYSIKNINLKSTPSVRCRSVQRVHQILEMEVASIMKGKFDHFMQKEIHEQPESVAQTMMGRVASAEDDSARVVDPYKGKVALGGLLDYLPAIKRSRRMIFVACGTSYHATMACRQTIERLACVPVALELASDLLDREAPIMRDDLCVFVSQSGETADTLQALHYAKKQGALCLGVTNTVGSAIAAATDCGIHINAGCEIGVASTKAYTSQIVAITMLALVMAEDSLEKKEKYNAVVEALQQLPDVIRRTLALDGRMRQMAEHLKGESSMLVFGRGHNYATALETALKIKEVALIHSEGVLAGEMKHGTLALVDETMPIVVIATHGSCYRKMVGVIEQLRARDARLIVLTNEGDELLKSPAAEGCLFIEVPKVEEFVQPVVNIVPLQLLSYHLTVLRGFNVDQPRNLAKSVTVSEE